MPVVSRGVGPEEEVRGLPSAEEVRTGEAWAMAIRQAMNRTVRGEGDGIGEEGPTRWIWLVFGVPVKLDFSESSLCLSKVGVLNMILGLAGGFA